MTLHEFWIMWFSMGALGAVYVRVIAGKPQPVKAYIFFTLLGGVAFLASVMFFFFDFMVPWLKRVLDSEF